METSPLSTPSKNGTEKEKYFLRNWKKLILIVDIPCRKKLVEVALVKILKGIRGCK